jgi:hypothetical protein
MTSGTQSYKRYGFPVLLKLMFADFPIFCDKEPYDGRKRPLKYGKVRVTTSRITVTVVSPPNVNRYGRRHPYDGTVHTVLTVYGRQP